MNAHSSASVKHIRPYKPSYLLAKVTGQSPASAGLASTGAALRSLLVKCQKGQARKV